LIVIAFVVFLIITVLSIALFYSGNLTDTVKMKNIQNYAEDVVSSAESVFYRGEPSKITIGVYLPGGVQDIYFEEDSLVIELETGAGLNKVAFSSNVPISGNLSVSSGKKRVQLSAQSNGVLVSEL
jgi:hypothetical protein